MRDSKKAAPAQPKARPRPGRRSRWTTPSTTSSTPIAACRPCARSPTSLAGIDEKKSLIYFSSGMDRTGIENQSQLRSATNAAVRANMAIYTMDIRGLQAMVPGGEAQNASLRGTSPYSGKSRPARSIPMPPPRRRWSRWPATPAAAPSWTPTISAGCLPECSRTRRSTTCSGYHSTNTARDGRFRRITVQGQPARLKDRLPPRLLRSRGLPAFHARRSRTQLRRRTGFGTADHRSAGVSVRGIFPHRGQRKFYVPVSVVVPGSQIPFTHSQRSGPSHSRRSGHGDRPGEAPGWDRYETRSNWRSTHRNWCNERTCNTTAASCCRPANII